MKHEQEPSPLSPFHRIGPIGLSIQASGPFSISSKPQEIVEKDESQQRAGESWVLYLEEIKTSIKEMECRIAALESRTWWGMLKDFLVGIFKHNANRI